MIERFESIPQSLQNLQQPVKELFYEGNPKLLEPFCVSIVGSRKASNYAKNMTYALAAALKEEGITVISGAAMGIDAMAHKGAMPNTVAVMGNSLDIQTPSLNKNLIQDIALKGLTLSEYPVTTHPTRYSFVERNRIVVALSDVVVLAQADLKSGTMHSARFALESGKRLFALVHNIGESLGTQKLLEEGKAEPIFSIEDFISKLSLSSKESVAKDEDELIAFCRQQPTYEEAVARFGSKLFEYELMGEVAVLNGRVVLSSSYTQRS